MKGRLYPELHMELCWRAFNQLWIFNSESAILTVLVPLKFMQKSGAMVYGRRRKSEKVLSLLYMGIGVHRRWNLGI